MNNNRLEEKRNGGKKKECLYYIKNQAIRVVKADFLALHQTDSLFFVPDCRLRQYKNQFYR